MWAEEVMGDERERERERREREREREREGGGCGESAVWEVGGRY